MRKAGADTGAAFSWGASVFLSLFVLPIQLAALLTAILIAW